MTPTPRLSIEPIGYIQTPYKAKYDAPHQPGGHGTAAEGMITLVSGQNFEQALQDLEGMDKLWILYWFDRNANWKPMVQVPRGERKKRGLFATRSPHRPNPIGLSLVDLVEIKGLTIRVRNVDMLDGSPIIDIKPYLPYLEAHPNAKAGWIDEAEMVSSVPEFELSYSELALHQLQFLSSYGVRIQERLERILSRDPSPHPYRRIEHSLAGLCLAYRAWRIFFSVEDFRVHIERIASGYSDDAIETYSEDKLSDAEAQRAFQRQWPQPHVTGSA